MKKRVWPALLALAVLLSLYPAGAVQLPENNTAPEQIAVHEGVGSLADILPLPQSSSVFGLAPNRGYNGSYYDQLDDSSKAVYDALYRDGSPLKEGPSTTRIPLTGVSYSDESKRSEPVLAALGALLYDHPELSWLVNTRFSYGYDPSSKRITSFAMTEEAYQNATTTPSGAITPQNHNNANTGNRADIQTALDKAKREIGDLSFASDYGKIRAIYNWICDHTEYADQHDSKFLNSWRGYQTAYSALVEGVTVCAGYAKSFKLLCDAYDIPCAIVTGTSRGSGHAWNYVQLDGKWYAIDCTWADQITWINYNYFLKGSAHFSDHDEGTLYSTFAFQYPTLSVSDYHDPSAPDTITLSYHPAPESTSTSGTPAFSVPEIPSLEQNVHKEITLTAQVLNGGEEINQNVTWSLRPSVPGVTLIPGTFHSAVLSISNSALPDYTNGSGLAFTVTASCSTTQTEQTFLLYVPARTPKFVQICRDGSALHEDRILAGSSAAYSAQVYDQFGQPLPEQTVTWEISNPSLAAMTDGVVSVPNNASGSFILSATVNDSVRAETRISITQKPPHELTVPETKTLTYGETGTLSATSTTGASLSYSSSNDSIVAVSSSGTLTAKAVGSAVIRVAAQETGSYGPASRQCVVTIQPKNLTDSMVTLSNQTLVYNGSAQLPDLEVKDGPQTLDQNDYTVTATNHINAGTASVTVSGAGNYTGSVTKQYLIRKANCTVKLPAALKTDVTIGQNYPANSNAQAEGVNGQGVPGYLEWYTDATCATPAGNGTFRSLGTTTLYWKFTPDPETSGSNYNLCSGSTAFTVKDLPALTVACTSPGEKTYGDEPFRLNVTVTDENGADQTASARLSYAVQGDAVTVSENGFVTLQKAGTAAVTVSANLDGHASSAITVDVTVKKRPITMIEAALADKVYDGTTAAHVTSVTFHGVAASDDLVLNADYTASAAFTDPNAGSGKDFNIQVTLRPNDKYVLTETSAVYHNGTIQRAPSPEITIPVTLRAGTNAPYTCDLTAYLPEQCGGTPAYTLEDTADLSRVTPSLEGSRLTLRYRPATSAVPPASETVFVRIYDMPNYQDRSLRFVVTYTDKEPVNLTAEWPENLTYDGTPKAVSVTSDKDSTPGYEASYLFRYTGTDNTGTPYDSSDAPIRAGSYTVTVSIPDHNTAYAGSTTRAFTIRRASATVTANAMTLTQGDTFPTVPAPQHYTVSGLIANDVLLPAPSGFVFSIPDTSTVTDHAEVTLSGAALSADGNYTITYQPGKLSVTPVNAPVATPTASPNGGTFSGSQRVSLSCATKDAEIYFTTDGSTPTTTSTHYDPASGLTLTETTTLKAIAVRNGRVSDILTVQFTRNASSGGGGGGGGGSSSGGSGGGTSTSSITVPVSGGANTVQVKVSVSGSTATITKIDTAQLKNIMDGNQTGAAEIDFTALNRSITAVQLPSNALGQIAAAAKGSGKLTLKLPGAEITFDSTALTAIQKTAGDSITLTVTQVKPEELNARQLETVKTSPVFDFSLRSGGQTISDFKGGSASVTLPHKLGQDQLPDGVVVYALDAFGNLTPCETSYDERSKTVTFSTGHLSLFLIGYDSNAAWENPFADVSPDAWYNDAIRFVTENGLMTGYTNDRFGPDNHLTRAQLAQILYTKEGKPALTASNPFRDVPDGAWYAHAVTWAASKGIVGGYGNGLFGPDDDITREQLAVMLWRCAGSPSAASEELSFRDAGDVSGYARNALHWAVENGILSGVGDNRLAPHGLATRAQAAQMLKNYLEL